MNLEKEREAFEAWQYSMGSNTASINGFYVNDRTSSEWFAWKKRANLAQAEITELKKEVAYLNNARKDSNGCILNLKQKLEAKHRAFVFLDDCRKEWHKSFMFKCEQLEELKKKLARYENPDYVLVPRELTENMRKEGREQIEYGKLCADAVYKAMIEAVEKDDE